MGLHKRHTHGRVFVGEAAREQLDIHRRDSHGNTPIMVPPEGWEEKQVSDEDPQQAANVVYVTLSQTFDGPAMYSTLTGPYNPEVTDAPQSTAENGEPNFFTGDTDSSTRKTRMGDNTAVETSTVIPQSSHRLAQATTLATSLAAASSTRGYVAGTPLQATSSATATAAPGESEAPSMTTGGKAGLAIGIIVVLGVIAAVVLLMMNRRKKTMKGEALNEKHGSFADVGARRAEASGMAGGMAGGMAAGAGAAAAVAVANKRDSSMSEKAPSRSHSTRTASTAPRLSLRPVTQFLPMIGDNKSNASVNGGDKSNSAWERGHANNAADPFADGSGVSQAPSNPFDEQRRSNESLNGSVAAAGAAAAADGKRHSPNASWEGSEVATPTSGPSGPAVPVPVAAGGAPPPRQPNNVHRVQLDFKPSMDDELELTSGALVRLLHEYDDGWALCITMDRSKQGVAPRTCLSKLPVKPRPQGPPPPQGYRPGPPNGPHRGPPPPQGAMRPSPAGAPGAMQPRPLTPQSARAPSPPEQQRPTEQPQPNGSASTSPVTSQVPKRKPVGQAL